MDRNDLDDIYVLEKVGAMRAVTKKWLPALVTLGLIGCGKPDGEIENKNTSQEDISTQPQPQLQDPAQTQISPSFDFRFSTKTETGLSNNLIVSQAAILSSRDAGSYDIRYITINNRPNCVLYPIIESPNREVLRFDVIENVREYEKIYEGTVRFSTGDQLIIGRPLNLSSTYGRREFVPYNVCGRPSILSVFTDQGKADFHIFLSGD